MRKHRFIGNFDLSKGELHITEPEYIKQIKGVLRLGLGDEIILGNGQGLSADGKIATISSKEITLTLSNQQKIEENGTRVNLYLAVLKKENFELAVQKAVECGVSKIIPIITERTVKTGLNVERLSKIIREASEQSGRTVVPELLPLLQFKDALTHNPAAPEKIIFHLSTEEFNPDKNIKTSNIFIGPEGGFTKEEVDLALNAGYVPASLGDFTLRGETAAIVATYRAVRRV